MSTAIRPAAKPWRWRAISIMAAFGFLVLVAGGSGWVASLISGPPDEAPAVAEPLSDEAAVKRILATVEYWPSWLAIHVDKADGRTYKLTLWYHEDVITDPQADTLRVARAVLKDIAKPADDRLYLSVTARQKVHGETGKLVTRLLGGVSFRWKQDQFEWIEP